MFQNQNIPSNFAQEQDFTKECKEIDDQLDRLPFKEIQYTKNWETFDDQESKLSDNLDEDIFDGRENNYIQRTFALIEFD